MTQKYPEVPLSEHICPLLLQGTGTLVWGQELSHGTGAGCECPQASPPRQMFSRFMLTPQVGLLSFRAWAWHTGGNQPWHTSRTVILGSVIPSAPSLPRLREGPD